MKKNLLILFCVTLFATILHSQANWELLNPKPSANTGKGIEFVSANIGYIITSNELLETTDAGNNWSRKQYITSGNDMSFYNLTGYIVGNNGYVLKSTDNGTSWSQISTGFNSSFNTVNIIDDNNVVLSSANSIVKTNDGGNNWVSLSIPGVSVNKTFFTNALVGHAVCNNGIIIKTIDGGENWYVTRNDSNILPSDYFTVYFVNDNIGFASREHDELYKTTNGGETWVELTGTSEAIYGFHFLDANNGFATGNYGATYKTNDGGVTWSPILFQNGYIDGTSMYGIYFQDTSIGYATGEHGRIIKTIDGGNTWDQYSFTYKDVQQIEIVNDNVMYIITGGAIYKSTDAGNTFVSIAAPEPNGYTAKISFVNENVGYAASGDTYGARKIFKTVDGGVTWNVTNNGNSLSSNNLKYVHFVNANVGFTGGGLTKTLDGGNTWEYVNTSINIGEVKFFNDQLGFARRVGNANGTLYKTTDGGTTWYISIQLSGIDINAFHFLDEDNGYIAGDEGALYKTSDGGATWQELDAPYEHYVFVKFHNINVGYARGNSGRIYRTENGGISWQLISTITGISDLELSDQNIYLTGSNGKIYKSNIQYYPMFFYAYPAENVLGNSVTLTGNATSNATTISDIVFQYGEDYSFGNSIAALPDTVGAGESLNVSVDLSNLQPDTTYYYRLVGTQNSLSVSSQILSFTTLSEYEITTNFSFTNFSHMAEVSGDIVSNGNDITNVEFQYGLSSDNLDSTMSGTPSTVLGNTSENITATLTNLEPETQYYYRIKATHEGEDIFGNIYSFYTRPDYNINFYSPTINGTDVTLSAYLTSYNLDITDIEFEYGTIDYENNISTSPSQIDANSSSNIDATLTGLDTDLNYYYRLKAVHNGETIYSEENVFNFSGDIIMVCGTIDETQTNSIELRGLINCYGSFLTNIQFEYGLTESFGSSKAGTPSFAYGNNTTLIRGLINNPLPNETYYYRLVATDNGNVIYSDTYQYTTGALSQTEFNLDNSISVYPNPTTNLVYIKSNVAETIKSIELYNALGQLIYLLGGENKSDLKIDLSSFEKGIYFLKVSFESSKQITSKLILK